MAKKKKAPVKKISKAKAQSAELMEKLKQFIRTQGADYLKDKNISSIGVGYKITDNKPTKEISIQFTVDSKLQPESLESVGTKQIPKTINIDGLEIPTDVIQRSFIPAFKIVAESTASNRKVRLDPAVPGISISHVNETAGTFGCIVYDKLDGTPYILSNWHVLNGATGKIGDTIVQPGPFDDDRVELNHIGKLVRSHLGPAGDCAIASIENRTFKEEIIDLNVKPDQIGEPDLGDKLIKSGRTTGVTHGIVTRIHTVVKINYDAPVGDRSIGGFEIGPDPDNIPGNGEISMGGDSGSAWIFKSSNGKPSKILAGLHFAGEGSSDPDEHAIACYSQSVFEKLNITIKTPDAAVPAAGAEPSAISPVGYKENFLGQSHIVGAPKLNNTNKASAFKLNGSELIHYTHFSLALNKTRKFAFWVGWNIDGNNIKKISRTGIKFDFDPRIPKQHQAGDTLYANNRLDRGHIARRADLVWGKKDEAEKANKDSFFFTNITPQMDNFNQGNLGGVWGRLEDAIFDEVDVDNLKVTVFGGPVFKNDDRVFKGFKIPREFFKVIVFVESGKLKARGFLLTQNLNQLEALDLNEFKTFQVKLSEIEQRCGFKFPGNLTASDGFAEKMKARLESIDERNPLESVSDIMW
jgi:endonuclease G, mitochondrial